MSLALRDGPHVCRLWSEARPSLSGLPADPAPGPLSPGPSPGAPLPGPSLPGPPALPGPLYRPARVTARAKRMLQGGVRFSEEDKAQGRAGHPGARWVEKRCSRCGGIGTEGSGTGDRDSHDRKGACGGETATASMTHDPTDDAD